MIDYRISPDPPTYFTEPQPVFHNLSDYRIHPANYRISPDRAEGQK